MPNWCDNSLVVTGDAQQIKAFIEKNKGTEPGEHLSFSALVPVPKVPDDKPVKGEGQVRAQTKAWGTKWEPENGAMYYDPEQNDETVEYCFATAWSPPCSWMATVAPMFADLSFRLTYDEEGIMFKGCSVAEKDQISVVTIPYDHVCPPEVYVGSSEGWRQKYAAELDGVLDAIHAQFVAKKKEEVAV